jgi:hypothetical protein
VARLARNGVPGYEQIDMPRQVAEGRVGRRDERPSGSRIARTDASPPFGHVLEVASRESRAEIPHQDAVPVAQ